MPELRADCANCAGLCCVAPTFVRSADFAISKPAGTPCPNLLADDRCAIHAQLRDRGFPGCAVFEAIRQTWPMAEVTVADRGLREGMLLRMMRQARNRGRLPIRARRH